MEVPVSPEFAASLFLCPSSLQLRCLRSTQVENPKTGTTWLFLDDGSMFGRDLGVLLHKVPETSVLGSLNTIITIMRPSDSTLRTPGSILRPQDSILSSMAQRSPNIKLTDLS